MTIMLQLYCQIHGATLQEIKVMTVKAQLAVENILVDQGCIVKV